MHTYIQRIEKARARGLLPAEGLVNVSVAHDPSCGIYRGRECDCNPEIILLRGGRRMRILADGSTEEEDLS